jgi:hypothetical protein
VPRRLSGARAKRIEDAAGPPNRETLAGSGTRAERVSGGARPVRAGGRGARCAVVLPLLALLLSAAASRGSGEAIAAAGPCPPLQQTPIVAPAPSTVLPSPDEVVVCVGTLPILGSTFVHWLHVAALFGSGGRHQPGATVVPGPPSAEARAEVLTFLISGDWLLGEATRLGVAFTAAQAKRAFDQLKAHAFHSRREFDAFLRRSGETVGDLVFRTELNLLSGRIQRRVLSAQHGAAAKQRALLSFVKHFGPRWEAMTVCEPAYAVSDCGRIQVGPL